MKRFLVLILVVLLSAGVSFADSKGTAKEAKSLVSKAFAFYKSNGKDAAFSEISNPRGKFVDRDLYVMVMDVNGNMLAHGANKKLIGKNLLDLKDSDGTPMVREFIKVAKSKGSGWVDYKWSNPVTRKVEHKSSFIQKIDGHSFMVCGIYK